MEIVVYKTVHLTLEGDEAEELEKCISRLSDNAVIKRIAEGLSVALYGEES